VTEQTRRKTLDQMMEEAMGPRSNPLQPIFRDHNCWKCGDGERPCAEGDYGRCSYPHARND
jgi:hypothetical protein